ncbi:MAG TPA: hypothetical protein VFB60_08050 [Ktedonobacteraceae bacterium]|nr:hypothetical protein [Ktedonobacteraceae bacterium]
MHKKIIALQLLGGLALYTVTYIVFISRIPGSTFLRPVFPKDADVFMFIEALVLLLGGIFVLLGTINSLVQQAKHRQWAWFVFTILFGPPCTLLWLLMAKPKKQEVKG